MFSLSTLVFTGLISLLAGAGLGAFLLYLFRAQVYSRELEQRLHEAENSLKNYQRDVVDHFAQTSQLVNNLTQSYRDVHEHLANSALKLATPAISRQILESANNTLAGTEKSYLNEQNIEAPKDWAPKATGIKSSLSDDFGLHDDHHDDDPQLSPEIAQHAPHQSSDDYHSDENGKR